MKHRHKLKLMAVGRNGHTIFKCVLPGCRTFYNSPQFAVGVESICWECGGESFIRETDLKIQKPVCLNCETSRRERRERLKAI